MASFKKILLYLIAAKFAFTFIQHGYLKFDPEGFWSNAFINTWGYGLVFMYFIGVLEFTGGIGILIPKISKYAALVLAIVMLGALFTRIIFGTSIGDVISITFNMVTLLYLSLENGMDEKILTLRERLK